MGCIGARCHWNSRLHSGQITSVLGQLPGRHCRLHGGLLVILAGFGFMVLWIPKWKLVWYNRVGEGRRPVFRLCWRYVLGIRVDRYNSYQNSTIHNITTHTYHMLYHKTRDASNIKFH